MATLDVHMGGRIVGTVDGSDRRNLRFAYAPAYANDPSSTPLSVSMPLRESTYSHATVNPYLWGLLPDNDRVVQRWAREFGCSPGDVTGLLAGVGTDVAGAAQYVELGAIPEHLRPGDVEWVDDSTVAGFLREVRRDSSAWHPHQQGRWSLAGAQAKIALLHDAASDRWGVPSGATPTSHILKPAIAELADFDINEHLCLAVARNLGLRAVTTSIRMFDDQRVLVVARYDRITGADGADGAIVRVHQEDLCQALRVHPDRKYESDGGPGAHQLGRIVREVAPADDVVRLHDALIYNWLTMSTDGHAKNFSLLLSGAQVRLAPLYDVASGLPYVHPQKARLAQRIGGENRPLRIHSRHWERLAVALGIEPAESRARIMSMIDRLPDSFDAAARDPAFTADERRVALAIAAQVSEWATARSTQLDR